MGRTLIISHDACQFGQIIAQLPADWTAKFDEIGFFSEAKDFHDEMDEWLIDQNAEEGVVTLLFNHADEALEYIGECVSNGDVVKVVSVGSDASGARLIREAYPEVEALDLSD